jgi:hypothetical protein
MLLDLQLLPSRDEIASVELLSQPNIVTVASSPVDSVRELKGKLSK